MLYHFSYNIIILLVTYMLPIVSMMYTYARVGIELWGSQSIGECTTKQMDSIKSKRKVSIDQMYQCLISLMLMHVDFVCSDRLSR